MVAPYMTATPIPRTLAVIMYGDLDISVLDELPPGRQKILTKAVTDKSREMVYKFVRGQAAAGRQIYVTAPLIDDSEEIDARSANSVFDELSKKFPECRIALLHGQMSEQEKNSIMEDFSAGSYDILVATVVIEVGIDVPNATVMVIESAERFGLAQLHQLRGRVGRGREQSYCILISNGEGEVAKDRARTMVESSDGFYIAEKDLELRGPGEFFGTRQHAISETGPRYPLSREESASIHRWDSHRLKVWLWEQDAEISTLLLLHISERNLTSIRVSQTRYSIRSPVYSVFRAFPATSEILRKLLKKETKEHSWQSRYLYTE